MPQTLLIVDDFKDYAALLEKALKAEGYQTVAVFDGEAAIQKARSVKPDLILLDIMMPNISGTEVRNALLNGPETRDIPVIYLTGLRAPHPSKKSLKAGVKVVGKSKDFREIIQAIRETLGKPIKN